MFYVEVTLRNGARISGVLNANNERHAIAQVRNTLEGRDARSVVATRTY